MTEPISIPELRAAITTDAREFSRCCDEPWGDYDALLTLLDLAEAAREVVYRDENATYACRLEDVLARFTF